MTVRLEGTTSAEVAAVMARERANRGGAAFGLVMTLVIAADEECASDAMLAAAAAAREHPCRVLVVIPRPGRTGPRLDAEVSVGGESPGETAVLRLRGHLSGRAASVVTPLLASDTPVVAWWPADPPEVPASDPLGALAQRRITDAAATARPRRALAALLQAYQPGDTDLAWTRCTQWRSLLAAAVDQHGAPVQSAQVHVAASNPSGRLLAGWLSARLEVPVDIRSSRGPGVTGVRLATETGDIVITRSDGMRATYQVPGQPKRFVSLPRRSTAELLAEELRRLDADPVYGAALAAAPLTPEPD